MQLQVLSAKPKTATGPATDRCDRDRRRAAPWTSNNRRLAQTTRRSSSTTRSAARRRIEASFDKFRVRFSAGPLLHEDRAGRRSRHADAVLPRRRPPAPADARSTPRPAARPALGRAALHQPGRPDARRRVPADFSSMPRRTPTPRCSSRCASRSTTGPPPSARRSSRPSRSRSRRCSTSPARAYRRPLTERRVQRAARALSPAARNEELPHDEAFRLTLARVLVSPAFPVSAAKRPGRDRAGAGLRLGARQPAQLFPLVVAARREPRAGRRPGTAARARRARRTGPADARDARVRRLATEFACQWLHIHDFDPLDEKSERHFPDVRRPRGANVRRVDPVLHRPVPTRRLGARASSTPTTRSSTNAWPSITAFPACTGAAVAARRRASKAVRPRRHPRAWRRRWPSSRAPRAPARSCAATGSARSCSARSCRRPPKDVPQLPDDEAATDGLTVRQLVEKHTQRREVRRRATADRPVRLRARELRRDRPLPREGPGRPPDRHSARSSRTARTIDGLDGPAKLPARRHAATPSSASSAASCSATRWAAPSSFPTNRCLTEMQPTLDQRARIASAAVEAIVRSRQFREIRGRDAVIAESLDARSYVRKWTSAC